MSPSTAGMYVVAAPVPLPTHRRYEQSHRYRQYDHCLQPAQLPFRCRYSNSQFFQPPSAHARAHWLPFMSHFEFFLPPPRLSVSLTSPCETVLPYVIVICELLRGCLRCRWRTGQLHKRDNVTSVARLCVIISFHATHRILMAGAVSKARHQHFDDRVARHPRKWRTCCNPCVLKRFKGSLHPTCIWSLHNTWNRVLADTGL